MKILSVIPLKKSILKTDLTYFTSQDIPVGNIVAVPLRNQKTLALVVSSTDLKDTKSDVKGMNFNLRKISLNMGESIFRKEYIDAIFESCDYFAKNKNSSMASLIPNIFIEKYDKLIKIHAKEKIESKKFFSQDKKLKTEKLVFQYPFLDRISIYKTLVRESFARGKSVFLILPTESDIQKFEAYLSKGIEQFTVSLHSGISSIKNLAQYEKIVSSSHPMLIIATPPFLSIPLGTIGTIILEHETSSAYRMQNRPHFDLRVFVEVYASKIGAKFIIADDLLRIETIGRKELDNLSPLHPLSFRIDFSGEIQIQERENASSRNSKIEGFRIFNNETLEEINSSLEEKNNVFIFSLRKGLATQTVCNDCGDTISCKKCGAPLILYLTHQGKNRTFVCNRCQEDRDSDTSCPSCQSWNLTPLGIGTDTVAKELEQFFPRKKIFKLDKETAKNASGARHIVKEWQNSPGSILVGTEMAFFYLEEKTPLSIIASFDSLWSIPNYKMSEKIIQIILSAIRFTEQKLIIQTKNGNDPIVRAIRSGNLLPYVRNELDDRKKFEYPPYKRFIKISFMGNKEETRVARKALEEIFTEYAPEIFSGFAAKANGFFTTNALIKREIKKWSLPEISSGASVDQDLLKKLSSLPSNFSVSVDPEDLL